MLWILGGKKKKKTTLIVLKVCQMAKLATNFTSKHALLLNYVVFLFGELKRMDWGSTGKSEKLKLQKVF